jgi:hypothetical protein
MPKAFSNEIDMDAYLLIAAIYCGYWPFACNRAMLVPNSHNQFNFMIFIGFYCQRYTPTKGGNEKAAKNYRIGGWQPAALLLVAITHEHLFTGLGFTIDICSYTWVLNNDKY